jgi:hypothetical protein
MAGPITIAMNIAVRLANAVLNVRYRKMRKGEK